MSNIVDKCLLSYYHFLTTNSWLFMWRRLLWTRLLSSGYNGLSPGRGLSGFWINDHKTYFPKSDPVISAGPGTHPVNAAFYYQPYLDLGNVCHPSHRVDERCPLRDNGKVFQSPRHVQVKLWIYSLSGTWHCQIFLCLSIKNGYKMLFYCNHNLLFWSLLLLNIISYSC